MAAIEGATVPGEQRPHGPRQGPPPRADERQHPPSLPLSEDRHALDEVGPIPIIPEDRSPLPASHHDMTEDARRVELHHAPLQALPRGLGAGGLDGKF